MSAVSKQNLQKNVVYVGLSGGVDSAVAAALLKQQGYEVVGVFIKIWQPQWGECNWQEDKRDAMKVAMHLNIKFKTLDLSDRYQKEVVHYMIKEYKAGRTPNPDVMCNTQIKFGDFLQWSLSQGADFVATGHYARVEREKKQVRLLAGVDNSKDQSYFLWQLKQAQLKYCLFPIGQYKKIQVRALAKKLGLPTATKKDSQGICFVGNIGMKDFLKKYIKPKRGQVLNEHKEVIGYHEGAFFLTIGQRRGFTITRKGVNDEPYYVINKNIKQNTITVAFKKTAHKLTHNNIIFIKQINWIADKPKLNMSYQARFRHLQARQKCKLHKQGVGSYEVRFTKKQIGIASGQSLVLYNKQVCLGGGIIN